MAKTKERNSYSKLKIERELKEETLTQHEKASERGMRNAGETRSTVALKRPDFDLEWKAILETGTLHKETHEHNINRLGYNNLNWT